MPSPSIGLSPEFLQYANPPPPQEAFRPSLAGPDMFGNSGSGPVHPQSGMKGSVPPALHQRSLTPEELMAWANREEQAYLDATAQIAPHSSSVEPALVRSQGGVPSWLEQYMSNQEDPLDSLGHKQHALEREALLQNKR
jgi:hypothetical protein